MSSLVEDFVAAAAAPVTPFDQYAYDRTYKFGTWIDGGNYKLRKPEAPIWHKLQDAWKADDGHLVIRDASRLLMAEVFKKTSQVFMVDHDWATVFAGAAEFSEGEYPPPYDNCVFEFAIGDYRVLSLVAEKTEGKTQYLVWVRDGDIWIGLDPIIEGVGGSLSRFMADNIRAICIALDAEVAYAEPVRASEKLNASRVKRGKVPLPPYRLVRLAQNKTRALPLEPEQPGTKKRLHFRRGHWRHLGNFKTWVRWCLVGDPDMSFVDKFYRL